MLLLHPEDRLFYWQEVLKLAVPREGRIECPGLFGFMPHTLQEEELKRIRFTPVRRPRKPTIYAPYANITKFSLHFVKQKSGAFCLSLDTSGFGSLVLHTLPCELSWTEFALYIDFALTHERVFYFPSKKLLIIKPTLGLEEVVLIN